MGPIYHLNVGNYVFKSIGFTDKDLPGLYVYEIHGNFGDLYKTEGMQKLIGKLCINKKTKKYDLIYMDDLLELDKTAEVVKLLYHNVLEN